jgi:integrase
MKRDQVDLGNAVVWIPDSKTPNGVAEVPLTPLAVQAFQDQLRIAGAGIYLFPSDKNKSGHQTTLKTVWPKTLKRARLPCFRILQPPFDVRHPAQRPRRCRRVGESKCFARATPRSSRNIRR